MARADDTRARCRAVAQADIQAVRQNDQPRGNLLAVRQRDALPVGARCDRDDLRWSISTLAGICARMVLTSVSYRMPCWSPGFLVDQAAEPRFPDFAVECARATSRSARPVLRRMCELRRRQLLAAQIRRIDGVRIDQDAEIPARPSMAAAVDPANPPPTIAISVYRMPWPLAPPRLSCAAKGKQSLKVNA